GHMATAMAFLLVGAGLHTTQTAGLALATDLTTDENRPRVVALLYVMLLIGMVASALILGVLLSTFDNVRLIRVLQGAASITLVLNVIALWKQETRDPARTAHNRKTATFSEAWQSFSAGKRTGRLLLAVGLGTLAFSMQDILLEPYGGEILGLSVAQTTMLTALLAGGTLVGLALAARSLSQGYDPYRLAAFGVLVGVFAFSAVILAHPIGSPLLFRSGTTLIGFGGGLFAVGMLTATMILADTGKSGIALGAWGAVQATAAGIGVATGGALRDAVSTMAEAGWLGSVLNTPATGYASVYYIEIGLLFATLIAIGPLVRRAGYASHGQPSNFGLAEFPG
ncbi:MAG: MFS transporter, partial [Pseudomonadota bacterium]